ncbi:CHAT domain-containing protein [Lusitaniella coriacea LEGE 07157]|uniref:CHAT domain-containing protein n=1 Tax=Lusitaniella coriacea LEGE 07157 TaxID=945747 RepID=A0A8J7DYU5_9CYAN|nr:CHAT domain-containing protein [Lusitaniella coriacea]MBE9118087.1 CHAT domain-containing protein [Lusitaniella coriacea LEGE 07157]
MFVSVSAIPAIAQGSVAQQIPPIATDARTLQQEARQLYEGENYEDAIARLEVAKQQLQGSGNALEKALVSSNLSLAYQAVGQWENAEEEIAQSLALLESLESSPQIQRATAGTLESRSQLELTLGKPEASLDSLQAAMVLYRELQNSTGMLRVGINQSFALQEVGRDRAALQQLLPLIPTILAQPDSPLKATAFRSLGNLLRVVGDDGTIEQLFEEFWQQPETGKLDDLEKSRQLLQQSSELSISSQDIARAHLSLGNTERAAYFREKDALERLGRGKQKQVSQLTKFLDAALAQYQKVNNQTIFPLFRLQAQLNSLSLLVDFERSFLTHPQALQQFPNLLPLLTQLPDSRGVIYAEINFVETLLKLGEHRGDFSQFPNNNELEEFLRRAIAQSKKLQDNRAKSYSTGMLGKLYETQQDWEEAQKVTQSAILLADAAKAPDILYQWQWQLGRVLREQRKVQDAIAVYEQAIATLDIVRQDLLSLKNQDTRFLFRDNVEPVYRELVDLLLQQQVKKVTLASEQIETHQDKKKLNRARRLMEQLQVAELEDYLRCQLGHNNLASLDEVIENNSLNAAVIYPIVLEDRLEIILKLPTKVRDKNIIARNEIIADSSHTSDLMHFTQEISARDLEEKVLKLREDIQEEKDAEDEDYRKDFNELYELLIRPLEPALEAHKIETLVFVLDNILKNLPISALYDGEQYVIEKYSIALNLGIELIDSSPFEKKDLKVLAAGVSEKIENRDALPNVGLELETIQEIIPSSKILLNQSFTTKALQREIETQYFPVLHLATHGKFSSLLEETKIWAYREAINVNQLENLLQRQQDPLELLVLSACETAIGDRRAMLGMAGIAFQAGAKSTIGSIFAVKDRSAKLLMEKFYRNLIESDATIAEALRRAQLDLLSDKTYKKPYHWSPYLLVGNWR